jgi:hypothetical protein
MFIGLEMRPSDQYQAPEAVALLKRQRRVADGIQISHALCHLPRLFAGPCLAHNLTTDLTSGTGDWTSVVGPPG